MALGLVLALTLVGCDGQSEVRGDIYTIYVHDALFPRGGLDGLIIGTLVTQGRCVLLEQERRDIAHPVIWPRGTSIASEDPLTLELPSGEELTVGQTVRGAGGASDELRVEVDIPSECVPETGPVMVFNANDDPVVVE